MISGYFVKGTTRAVRSYFAVSSKPLKKDRELFVLACMVSFSLGYNRLKGIVRHTDEFWVSGGGLNIPLKNVGLVAKTLIK